jgi:ribosomal peptide maturation radical SAM protein 1
MAIDHKIVLVSMPWATIRKPSLALGILAAICQEKQVSVTILYPNMDLNAMIGFEVGQLAVDRRLYGLTEHLFACDLFDPKSLKSDEYLESFIYDLPTPFNNPAFVKHLRDVVVPIFLDKVQNRVAGEDPSAVGFSAMFNQVMPSLALARRLKRIRRDTQILAGGACFDGEMGQEYHRALPDVLDHVFMGEAEEPFREYLRRLVAGKPTNGIPGVTDFVDGQVRLIPGQPLANMNQSPIPDHDGYFLEKDRLLKETGTEFPIDSLPFESSRGCWWGQKKHCMFCGLNDQLMRFREKDVDRVVSEMTLLSSKYHVLKLLATDWIISRKSRGAIFKKLKDLDAGIEVFYETRSDMSKEEIALMRDAGVLRIQPGIESLSTELLQLMKKATSRIRQVQFLRWCREYGIHPSWFILSGFPSDKAEWYLEMANFLPRIFHLQPPFNVSSVEMHRFSPLFEKRDEFGVTEWQIRGDYSYNFPTGFLDPKKIGYFFEFRSSKITPPEQYANRLCEMVGRWKEAHATQRSSICFYTIGLGFLYLTDRRSGEGEGRYYYLEGLAKDIVLLTDKIQSVSSLKKLLAPLYPSEVEGNEIEAAVEELVEENILMREGELVLTLPIGSKPRTTKELYAYVLGKSPVADEVDSLT